MSRRNLRNARMAKHALIGNETPRRRMRRIEPGTHPPIPALLGVPSERKLDKRAARHAMKIRALVRPGPDHVIDLCFLYIRFFPAKTELPAPLRVHAVALDHRIARIGERMNKVL